MMAVVVRVGVVVKGGTDRRRSRWSPCTQSSIIRFPSIPTLLKAIYSSIYPFSISLPVHVLLFLMPQNDKVLCTQSSVSRFISITALLKAFDSSLYLFSSLFLYMSFYFLCHISSSLYLFPFSSHMFLTPYGIREVTKR